MIIPTNWNELQEKGNSEGFKRLPAGAYICKILNAVDYVNPKNGNESIKISVDIIEGEYKDYFRKEYENNKLSERKWSNDATTYIATPEFLKGLKTSIEKSNLGVVINIVLGQKFDCSQLNGHKVVGVFRLEEYTNQKGEVKARTRLDSFRSLESLSNIKTPDVRLIGGGYMNYEEYMKKKPNTSKTVSKPQTQINESDLPF